MPAVTAAELVCEYLFALVKIKDGPSVQVVRKRTFFTHDFLSLFILTIMVQHGKVYF